MYKCIEKRLNNDKRPFFINHKHRTTSYEHPNALPLPFGWELRFANQRNYFIDHNSQLTTFEDPRCNL